MREDRPKLGSLIQKDYAGSAVGFGDIGTHDFRVTKLSSLLVGPKEWRNVYFAVTKLKYWGLAGSGGQEGPFQGLLGFEILAGHGALIDFSSA